MDREIKALKITVVLLLALAAGRWLLAPPPAEVGGGPPVGTRELLDSSRAELDEAEARKAPLSEGEKIDPNTADDIALDRLPGVGPSTAKNIVADREANGPFSSVTDLTRVRGIGPATLARMTPFLEVVGAPSGAGDGRARPQAPSPTEGAVGPPASGSAGLVDVNVAGVVELQSLPGIGPALAERIVEARNEARFERVEDLLRVRGIGPGILTKLRPLVSVR